MGRHTTPASLEVWNSSAQPFERLTDTELNILYWLTIGIGDRAIAGELFRSPFTIQNHVRTILRKLRATNRTQAVVNGLRFGLIEVNGIGDAARIRACRSTRQSRSDPELDRSQVFGATGR
jgi:DNA-binding CsgD family transcriptional regulator